MAVSLSSTRSDAMPPLPRHDGVQFRHVPDWPGYAVTDSGQMWSCRRRRWGGLLPSWVRLKDRIGNNGRVVVMLQVDKTKKLRMAHQLVMWAFVGPCPPGMEIAHNDGDPTNNHLSNLRYATRAGNHADTFLHGTATVGAKHGMSKATVEMVKDIRDRAAAGESDVSLSRRFHLGETTIANIRHRRTWKHVN